MAEIPGIKTYNNPLIPDSVAEISDEVSTGIESKKFFVISFSQYNEKCCEIDQLLKNAPKEVLKIFKKIGTISNSNDFQKNGINKFPIKNDGEYSKLFKKLPDINLFEHKIHGTQRIFYYLIEEAERIFNVIAITCSHYETEKVRH